MTISETASASLHTPLDEAATTRYQLNPAVNIIRCSDNEIFIHLGSRGTNTHRIQDTKNRGTLADFALSFRNLTDVSTAATASGTDEADAYEYIDHLRAGQALLTEDELGFGFLLAGMDAVSAPTVNGVSICGSGRIAQALARQLEDVLGAEVHLTEDPIEAFDTADFVVVATDAPNPGLCFDADDAAANNETPWQLVYADGAELIIGPTFIPSVTGNYYDFDSFDESGRTMRMDHQFLKSAVPAEAASTQLPHFVADLAASYATVAIIQHLCRTGSYLENHLLRVDLGRMHVMRERVMRLPRNPRDIGARDNLRHPFL